MQVVTKGIEKVILADKESARTLIHALSDYDAKENYGVQHIIGTDNPPMFMVSFDDRDISTVKLEDAEMIAHWMLALDCTEIIIRRIANE